jgi:hypothetical protein
VLKGGRKGSEQLGRTEGMQAAFKQSKESLCQATTLAHPDSRAQMGLWVDASAAHIGAVAQQHLEPGGVWQPLGFDSRKLAAAEVKYSAFDRELLACRDGIRHFGHLLEGRVFTIFTDHKPLVHAIGRISDPFKSLVPFPALFLFIFCFSYETYINTIFILGLVFACWVYS